MKLTKKNIGDLVWIKWRDHSSTSGWREKSGLEKDSPVTIVTIGIYNGKTKHEEITYSSLDLNQSTVGMVFWILKPDIIEVRVILKKKEVAKL